jgi:hypothetical protein
MSRQAALRATDWSGFEGKGFGRRTSNAKYSTLMSYFFE